MSKIVLKRSACVVWSKSHDNGVNEEASSSDLDATPEHIVEDGCNRQCTPLKQGPHRDMNKAI